MQSVPLSSPPNISHLEKVSVKSVMITMLAVATLAALGTAFAFSGTLQLGLFIGSGVGAALTIGAIVYPCLCGTSRIQEDKPLPVKENPFSSVGLVKKNGVWERNGSPLLTLPEGITSTMLPEKHYLLGVRENKPYIITCAKAEPLTAEWAEHLSWMKELFSTKHIQSNGHLVVVGESKEEVHVATITFCTEFVSEQHSIAIKKNDNSQTLFFMKDDIVQERIVFKSGITQGLSDRLQEGQAYISVDESGYTLHRYNQDNCPLFEHLQEITAKTEFIERISPQLRKTFVIDANKVDGIWYEVKDGRQEELPLLEFPEDFDPSMLTDGVYLVGQQNGQLLLASKDGCTPYKPGEWISKSRNLLIEQYKENGHTVHRFLHDATTVAEAFVNENASVILEREILFESEPMYAVISHEGKVLQFTIHNAEKCQGKRYLLDDDQSGFLTFADASRCVLNMRNKQVPLFANFADKPEHLLVNPPEGTYLGEGILWIANANLAVAYLNEDQQQIRAVVTGDDGEMVLKVHIPSQGITSMVLRGLTNIPMIKGTLQFGIRVEDSKLQLCMADMSDTGKMEPTFTPVTEQELRERLKGESVTLYGANYPKVSIPENFDFTCLEETQYLIAQDSDGQMCAYTRAGQAHPWTPEDIQSLNQKVALGELCDTGGKPLMRYKTYNVAKALATATNPVLYKSGTQERIILVHSEHANHRVDIELTEIKAANPIELQDNEHSVYIQEGTYKWTHGSTTKNLFDEGAIDELVTLVNVPAENEVKLPPVEQKIKDHENMMRSDEGDVVVMHSADLTRLATFKLVEGSGTALKGLDGNIVVVYQEGDNIFCNYGGLIESLFNSTDRFIEVTEQPNVRLYDYQSYQEFIQEAATIEANEEVNATETKVESAEEVKATETNEDVKATETNEDVKATETKVESAEEVKATETKVESAEEVKATETKVESAEEVKATETNEYLEKLASSIKGNGALSVEGDQMTINVDAFKKKFQIYKLEKGATLEIQENQYVIYTDGSGSYKWMYGTSKKAVFDAGKPKVFIRIARDENNVYYNKEDANMEEVD